MVFANLGPQEKDAFFSLLDEYFASRPEILTNNNNSSSSGHNGQAAAALVASSSAAAASAVKNAVTKRPEQAAKYMTAGLKHFAGSNSNNGNGNSNSNSSNTHGNSNDNRTHAGGSGSGSGSGNSNNNKGGPGESAEEEIPSMAGRIAAAQAMFSGKHNPFSKHLNPTKDPSPGPSSPSPSPSAAPPPPPASSYGTSSASSVLKSAVSGFAAPPVRRTPSNTLKLPPPPSVPPPVREERGEWVEALYAYNSTEDEDLNIEEGQRILLVERNTDEWWTGEVNGNKGLFPASYVKML